MTVSLVRLRLRSRSRVDPFSFWGQLRRVGVLVAILCSAVSVAGFALTRLFPLLHPVGVDLVTDVMMVGALIFLEWAAFPNARNPVGRSLRTEWVDRARTYAVVVVGALVGFIVSEVLIAVVRLLFSMR